MTAAAMAAGSENFRSSGLCPRAMTTLTSHDRDPTDKPAVLDAYSLHNNTNLHVIPVSDLAWSI